MIRTERLQESVRAGETAAAVILLAALPALMAAPHLARAAEEKSPPDAYEGSCLRHGCHEDLIRTRSVHAPVQEEMCDACHEIEEGHRFAPPPGPEETCFACHEAEEGETVHPPYEEMMCDACHSPHASSNRMLLRETPPDLCGGCHDAPEVEGERRHLVCTSCHDPHAGPPSLLQKPPPELCLGCHQGPVDTGERKIAAIGRVLRRSQVVHPPAEEDCTVCHDPHALQTASYLGWPFPTGPYAPYEPEAYEMCFQCHGDLLQEETGFRKGDVNLHRIHVGGERGRTCVTCHDPHGGGPRLIRPDRPYGRWLLPIQYEPRAGGGGCRPGCHEPRTYGVE